MKYGIQHDNGKVISINKFADDIVPGTHTEITEAKYNSFINTIKDAGLNVNFDPVKLSLTVDQVAVDAENEARETAELRSRLREMSIELDLAARMGEDTTDLAAEFDTLKADYQGR